MSAIKHYCKKYLIRPEIWIRNTVMLGFLTRDRFLMFHEDFFLHRIEKRKNKRKFWSTNIVLNLKFVQELHMKEHSWIRHISFSIVRRFFFQTISFAFSPSLLLQEDFFPAMFPFSRDKWAFNFISTQAVMQKRLKNLHKQFIWTG